MIFGVCDPSCCNKDRVVDKLSELYPRMQVRRNWEELEQGEMYAIAEIEGRDVARMKEKFPESASVLILPANLAEFEKQVRAHNRFQSEAEVREKMATSLERFREAPMFDYRIIYSNVYLAPNELFSLMIFLRGNLQGKKKRKVPTRFSDPELLAKMWGTYEVNV